MTSVRSGPTPLEYVRLDDDEPNACLSITPGPRGPALPKSVFGNFLEHMGFAIQGGLWAQVLANAVFERETNLLPAHMAELLLAGKRLIERFQCGGYPAGWPLYWTPGADVTGFGVAALDNALPLGVPFPWAPVGAPGHVGASLGRLGGAVRLRAGGWNGTEFPGQLH